MTSQPGESNSRKQHQPHVPSLLCPFAFPGESNSRNNTNLVDAVLLGAKRIGHGLNAYWNPLVRRELKAAGTPLEVCPLSNQILR